MYTWTRYQLFWLLDCLVAHVCYQANCYVCHTAAILDVAHCNIQQPAHNLVAVYTCYSQSHFLPCIASSEYDARARDVTATCNHAHLGTRSIICCYCMVTNYACPLSILLSTAAFYLPAILSAFIKPTSRSVISTLLTINGVIHLL